MVSALQAGLLILCFPLAAMAQSADTLEREQQRAEFRQAWSAAARGDQRQVMESIQRLDDYPLVPYLEFELLRQRIDTVPAPVVLEFLARYRDWSFRGALETRWLRSLGRQRKDELLLEHGGESTDQEVRCHVAAARIREGRTDDLAEEIRALWLTPRSVHSSCDTPFSWWRNQGNPDAETAWQRFSGAVHAGELGLASYLRRYLGEEEKRWGENWVTLARRGPGGLREARSWPDHPLGRELIATVLQRQATGDWKNARQEWRAHKARGEWPESLAGRVERQIALFQAVDLDEGAIEALDALPEAQQDQQILEWRARAALAGGRWQDVLDSIARMDDEEGRRGSWRYWRSRALAELERPEAALHFATLAEEPHYYGFLAADRLGSGYRLCTRELKPDSAIQRRLSRDAEVERALELFLVGQNHHARRTWLQATRRMSAKESEQLALLAASRGWYERSIGILAATGMRNAYPWRFPLLERARVEETSRRYGVDAAWVYGLMRAESAMQPDAISPAGARGLLQLMPDTARAVASRNGLAYNGPVSLLEPETNIPLGVAHLGELQARFDGHQPKVAGAYNAGIRSVERWMDRRPDTEPDIWIETLPFYETRDYIPRVVAFATVYDWLLNGQPATVSSRLMLSGVPVGQRAPLLECPSEEELPE